MKIVDLKPGMTAAELVSLVEAGEELLLQRDGIHVARLGPVPVKVREPGSWRKLPGWENFVYDPAIFASMTDEELKEEGWP